MTHFFSSVPVGRDSVTVSQHAQYQHPETEAAAWHSDVMHFIIHTCDFSPVTCQNVFCEKALRCLRMLYSNSSR